ncbi:MAG: EthD domain-containing protein [Gammaproteobacteria bacterium]|nr:EthD domain-containing protein [Gammaproteobacteria bacterium]
MIKMVVEVWKKAGMSDEAFAQRWLVDHGRLVLAHAKAMGFVRYVQSHKLPSPEIEAFASGRGWKTPPDALTEIWWESKESMVAAMGTPEGQAASAILAEDEVQFIESSKISAFLSEEKVIFDFVGDNGSDA